MTACSSTRAHALHSTSRHASSPTSHARPHPALCVRPPPARSEGATCQAPLIQCVDPTTVPQSRIRSSSGWVGGRCSSGARHLGAPSAPASPSLPATTRRPSPLLQNGRRMNVRGDFEEERLLTLDAPRDGSTAAELTPEGLQHSVLLDATSTSFERAGSRAARSATSPRP